ncbi:hypothetical protein FS749_011808 [Ceratobasidium sp. UAMH 11750]|nr:hypothetical protein FS749_011808 [Ceratobasidium sp. UAMH 11750]
MLRGGTTGIAVAFFAILHYALNIARVMPKTQEDAERLFDQEETVYGRPDFRTLDRCVEAVAQQLEECAISEWAGLRLTGSDLEDRYSAWSPKVWVRRNSDGEDEEARFTKSRPSFNVFLADADSYMDSPGPTPTGTPRESTRVTPEAAGAASSVAGATPTGEGGVAEQTDVPMNDPEPGPNSNVVGQEPVDSRAADIQNGDAPLSEFGGATTSTPRGEGQARQAVVSGTAIQGQEARTAESPIARKTPAPSRDLQPTEPVSEQPPATPAPAMPSLPVDNPSTTKLWKFSERLRAASTGVQQQAQKAASSTTADAGSRSSENGAGSSANASRKRARAKVSTESAAPETSKKAK